MRDIRQKNYFQRGGDVFGQRQTGAVLDQTLLQFSPAVTVHVVPVGGDVEWIEQ